jgi:hypothetical protein
VEHRLNRPAKEGGEATPNEQGRGGEQAALLAAMSAMKQALDPPSPFAQPTSPTKVVAASYCSAAAPRFLPTSPSHAQRIPAHLSGPEPRHLQQQVSIRVGVFPVVQHIHLCT